MHLEYFSACLGTFLSLLCFQLEPAKETSDETIVSSTGLPTDTPALLEYLKKRTPADPDEFIRNTRALVEQLGSDDFDVREKASRELVNIGFLAIPEIKRALKSGEEEANYRAERCLNEIAAKERTGVMNATIRLLGSRKATSAVDALVDFLPYAQEPSLSEDIFIALERLAVTDGKPAVGLVRALKSPSARKRSASAELLGKAGVRGEQASIRKLLADPNPSVQLGAATGLLWLSDAEAVEPLIGLLPKLLEPDVFVAEGLLLQLAQGKEPNIRLGKTPEDRLKASKAWLAWWKQNRNQVDLTAFAKLDRQPILFREMFDLKDDNIMDRYKQMRLETRGAGKGSVKEGQLALFSGNAADSQQSLVIQSSVANRQRTFPRKFQVRTRIGGEAIGVGGWHVGISIGDVRMLFHPGYAGGAFRIEKASTTAVILNNVNMPFTPKGNVLHDMTIDVETTGETVTLKILIEEGGNTGMQFRQTVQVKPELIGPIDRVSLDRSGRSGGAGLFGALVIKR